MSAIDPHQPFPGRVPGEPARTFEEMWGSPKGLAFITGVSHRTIGARFVITGFVFFLIGGIFALLMRLQLAFPDGAFLTDDRFNQLFTMHGTVMMFLFAVPILEGIAIYLLPMMLGARDLVFPRLSLYGYLCYLLGGILLLSSFLFDAVPNSGWFMYTPLSSKTFTPDLNSDFWLIGVTFVEISSVAAAIEIVVSILVARAPGMTLTKMPIFAWYMLATAFMIVVGFPPLIMGSVMLEAERLLGMPFFDPLGGGDPLLWQHLFWLFGHPEVYIVFLPAAGMVATILPTFVGRPLFGYGFVVTAIVAMAFLSFGLWVHHMFATGLPQLSLAYFAGASMAVAIPTGIQIFCLIATLASGRPRLEPPMLFILGFFFVFVAGGVTGVMLAAAPFNWQAHDTYFVVAHLHYVLVGGMVFPLLAGLYYWAPQVTGHLMSKTLGAIAFWLIFIGFNVTFLPMHLTGFIGMPRRISTYPEGLGWDTLNLVSTFGAFVLAAGFAVFIVDILRSRRHGIPTGRNPWGAATLEWLHAPPVPNYNFTAIPHIRSREPLWDQPELQAEDEEREGYLRVANDGKRETIGVHAVTGAPLHIIRLPRPSWWPVFTAFATAAAFIGILSGQYWITGLGLVAIVAGFYGWAWEPSDSGTEKDALSGLVLPIDIVSRASHSWYGTWTALLVVAALYFSLVFGYLFLWTARPDFFPEAGVLDATSGLLAAGAALLLAGAATIADLAHRRVREGAVPARIALLVILALLGACGAIFFLAGIPAGLAPDASAYNAVVWMLVFFVSVQLGILVLWHGFILARILARRIHPHTGQPLINGATYSRAIGAMVLMSLALLFFAPGLLGGGNG